MNQRGAVIIFVAIILAVLIGMAALALDLGHLYLVRNELQNASDSGALAGARFLYTEDGSMVNIEANDRALIAAQSNTADRVIVDINDGDIERGHWSFGLGDLPRGFTPNDSLVRVDLARSLVELDQDSNFINAVRVRTRRQATQAASFFARIFGYTGFTLATEAVAYIGFAADVGPATVDMPVAICKQSILDTQEGLSCVTGRMLNSNPGNLATFNTAGWSAFEQPCGGAANTPELRGVINSGNTYSISLGSMSTQGGVVDTIINNTLMNKWIQESNNKTQLWKVTLPVIDCPGNNIGPCSDVLGFVKIKVVWINGNIGGNEGESGYWSDLPTSISDPEGEWSTWPDADHPVGDNTIVKTTTLSDGSTWYYTDRWLSIVDHFNLKDFNNLPAGYRQKSIYFVPSCIYQDIIGNSGGDPFGILARIPKLVQ